jgi:ketopantoate reductase
MRYVIVGLGGIGGTLAGLLHETGSDVVGVARAGPHLDALQQHQSMTVRA